MARLPVEPLLPQICAELRAEKRLVLVAPPGAGKTTLVPGALAEVLPGQIVLLEPRRVAAKTAARRIAQQRGERVGQSVGYIVRHDRQVSDKTRILVVTEGVLTRWLVDDPFLSGVSAVLLDEFHERSVHADLALSLGKELLGVRDDFHLLVMSATLDADRVAAYLDDAPVLESEGRPFALTVEHRAPGPDERLDVQVRRALLSVLQAGHEGDVLVFLPGMGDIERTAERLRGDEQLSFVDVHTLYSAMPDRDQDAVFQVRDDAARRVILSTNIAESSVTVPRVRVVIDSGLERRVRFDERLRVDVLETKQIGRQSADQRAGRAGRLGPGHVVRLYGEGTYAQMKPHPDVDIRRTDPSAVLLAVLAYRSGDPRRFDLLDPLDEGRWALAEDMLSALGALDETGHGLSPRGHKMARLPLSPRLAALCLAGAEHDVPGALLAAAWLEDARRPGDKSAGATCELTAEAQAAARRGPVEKTVSRLARAVGLPAARAIDAEALRGVLLDAFPDQVGRARAADGTAAQVARGFSVEVRARPLHEPRTFFVASHLRRAERGPVRADVVSWVTLDDIRGVLGGRIERRAAARLDGTALRFETEERLYGLTLSRVADADVDPARRSAALYNLAREDPARHVRLDDDQAQKRARLRFAQKADPSLQVPDLSDEGLLTRAERFGHKLRTLDDVKRIDLVQLALDEVPYDQQQNLVRRFPSHIEVPSGRRLRIDYDAAHDDGPPVLPVKLQEMFGQVTTPAIDDGRVALLLHLLAPNRRPIQVTQDLQSFWQNAYPEVKKELKRRYAKHPWPDDPHQAVATHKTKKQR